MENYYVKTLRICLKENKKTDRHKSVAKLSKETEGWNRRVRVDKAEPQTEFRKQCKADDTTD